MKSFQKKARMTLWSNRIVFCILLAMTIFLPKMLEWYTQYRNVKASALPVISACMYGCALFAAMSNYQAGYKGGRQLELVSNAVCDTGTEWDSMAQQAWGMSLIMNLPYDDNAKAPELYPVERPVEPIAGPLETDTEEDWPQFGELPPEEAPMEEKVPEEAPKQRSYAFPAALGIFLLGAIWVLIPKKPKKRNRREKPKMNWDVE
jgi:hypothetical protein